MFMKKQENRSPLRYVRKDVFHFVLQNPVSLCLFSRADINCIGCPARLFGTFSGTFSGTLLTMIPVLCRCIVYAGVFAPNFFHGVSCVIIFNLGTQIMDKSDIKAQEMTMNVRREVRIPFHPHHMFFNCRRTCSSFFFLSFFLGSFDFV